MTDDWITNNEKNVKVFIRILPLEKPCDACARIDVEGKKIYIRSLQEMQANRITKTKDACYWCFQADDIFQDCSQEDVYRATSKDLVQNVLDGVSCVVMGYGQTGSGKSFTVGGFRNNWEHRGLVTRILSDLFVEKVNRSKVSDVRYELSFVELHGKDVVDLLLPKMAHAIKINERDPFKDISTLSINNEKNALEMIFEGESRRSFVKGATYPDSHLATAVITFHVFNKNLITSCGGLMLAKLHIVELAGIDTVWKENCWKPGSDVGLANLTKSELEQFFLYLRGSRRSASNVIRSSNLLKILGNAFSLTSVIRFISHVRITKEDLKISLSTLKLSSRISKLKATKTRRQLKPHEERTIQSLLEEVNSLKKELIINQMLFDQEFLVNISKLRAEQIKADVLRFLNGDTTDLELLSVSQIQVLLSTIKNLYDKLSAEKREVERMAAILENAKSVQKINTSAVSLKNGANNNRRGSRTPSRISKEAEPELVEQVGILDKNSVSLGPAVEVPIFPRTVVHDSSETKVLLQYSTIERAKIMEKRYNKLQRIMANTMKTREKWIEPKSNHCELPRRRL